MWYNFRPMPRRAHVIVLLLLVAVQLVGSIAFALPCDEPCDDDNGADCPPACAFCTDCACASPGIVPRSDDVAPQPAADDLPSIARTRAALHIADDILHVPLAG